MNSLPLSESASITQRRAWFGTDRFTVNQIWALDAAFANYFLPSLRLASKHRDGAKVVKKYHQAATPHPRALAHPATRKRPIITMNARFKKLRLGALQREILEHTGRLEALAQPKRPTARQPRPRPAEPEKTSEATTPTQPENPS